MRRLVLTLIITAFGLDFQNAMHPPSVIGPHNLLKNIAVHENKLSCIEALKFHNFRQKGLREAYIKLISVLTGEGIEGTPGSSEAPNPKQPANPEKIATACIKSIIASGMINSDIQEDMKDCYVESDTERTLLMKIIEMGFVDTLSVKGVFRLLGQGSLSALKDKNGNNVLHLCAMSHNEEMCKKVMDQLKCNLKNDNNEIIKLFDEKNKDDNTPKDLAHELDSEEVVDYLGNEYIVLCHTVFQV